MLPDQVLVKIFSYFEYKDLLLAAALVCKRWEKLSSDSDLWQSLDLSRLPGRSDISTRTVAKLVKRTTGMKHINLKNCGNISNIVISNIAKQEMLRTLILHELEIFLSAFRSKINIVCCCTIYSKFTLQ